MSGSFVTISENEIDKGVVFLGREHDQSEPAEAETERGLWQRHLLGPTPRLFSRPNDDRSDRDRNQIVRLIKNAAQERGAGLRVVKPKHAGEIGQRARQ